MFSTRQMLAQILGLVATCLVLILIIRLRQGMTFDALMADPRVLFDGMFSGPSVS